MSSDVDNTTKRCILCQEEKVLSEFHKLRNGKDRRCKSCIKIRDRKNHKRLLKEKKDWLYNYKETNPCTDCKKFYHPWVMEFDHLRDKKANISRLANQRCTMKRFLAEIDKCELVCANCHRLRTYKRYMSS